MHTRTIAAALAAGLLLALTACSSSGNTKADPAACKAAMGKDLAAAIAAGDEAEQSKRPAACNGIDDKTAQRIAGELIAEQLGKTTDDATSSAEPEPATVPVSAECRAWIETELRSNSDAIDAAAGQSACSELTDDELDQAIDEVTNELIEQGATNP